jgi:hypothetical protein
MTRHCGGKMDETRTRFCEAIPASRSASSNDVSRSLCLPTPLVKKIFFGTMLFPNFYVSSVCLKIVLFVQGSRMSLSHSAGLKEGPRGIQREFIQMGTETAAGMPLGSFLTGARRVKILGLAKPRRAGRRSERPARRLTLRFLATRENCRQKRDSSLPSEEMLFPYSMFHWIRMVRWMASERPRICKQRQIERTWWNPFRLG